MEIILKVLLTFLTDYVFDNLIITDFILQMMWLSLCSDGLKQLLSECSWCGGDLAIKFNDMLIRCKEVRNVMLPQICLPSL